MRILVSDTSVMIDLERSGLLAAAFHCGHEFVMPDLLFEREFGDNDLGMLTMGLQIEALSPQELQLAQLSHRTKKALSLPDCFAMALASRPNYCLLSGDKALRQIAEMLAIECHGVLWLMDEMLASGASSREDLSTGLRRLADHPRCRLPRAEIDARLKRWRKT
jgi:predicted nucleic acid-binding protein